MIKVLSRVLYWLVVLLVSAALVFALIRFFEARDESQVEGAWASPPVAQLVLTTGGLRST